MVIAVRDLSSSAKCLNRRKILGVYEKGTKGPEGVQTGLNSTKGPWCYSFSFTDIRFMLSVNESHVDDHSITGDMIRKNFNVPERDPILQIHMSQLFEITELKANEDSNTADNNLRVVMDVVYNRMYSSTESNFHKLVPGYYYRYNEDGTFANGTGVGNDTASKEK